MRPGGSEHLEGNVRIGTGTRDRYTYSCHVKEVYCPTLQSTISSAICMAGQRQWIRQSVASPPTDKNRQAGRQRQKNRDKKQKCQRTNEGVINGQTDTDRDTDTDRHRKEQNSAGG